MCRDPVSNGARIERPLEPQCPGKRFAALGGIKTLRNRVHMRSPPRTSAALIGYDATDGAVDVPGHAEKVRLRRLPPAPHTGTDRLRAPHL